MENKLNNWHKVGGWYIYLKELPEGLIPTIQSTDPNLSLRYLTFKY